MDITLCFLLLSCATLTCGQILLLDPPGGSARPRRAMARVRKSGAGVPVLAPSPAGHRLGSNSEPQVSSCVQMRGVGSGDKVWGFVTYGCIQRLEMGRGGTFPLKCTLKSLPGPV